MVSTLSGLALIRHIRRGLGVQRFCPRIATAQKTDADLVARIREEGRKELEAELKRKLDEAARNDGFDAEAAEEARRILGFA